MTRGELFNNMDYRLVTISRARGYVSRKHGNIPNLPAVPYSGKYGVGYTVLCPAWDSTRYCFKEYWIKVEKEAEEQ